MGRPATCRTPASCCPAFPAWAPGSVMALGNLTDEPADVRRPARCHGFALQQPRAISRRGSLPATHQGTRSSGRTCPIRFRSVSARKPPGTSRPRAEREGRQLLTETNRDARSRNDRRFAARSPHRFLRVGRPHAADRPGRVRPGQRNRPKRIALYGLDDKPHRADFGRNCLIARRLLERGVRFVQVWSGAAGPTGNWDNHGDIATRACQPICSADRQTLRAPWCKISRHRGLLDDTLVIWTTEFGRMPFCQGTAGRDHNAGTFVSWLAGAGVAAGVAYGQSDDWGWKSLATYDLVLRPARHGAAPVGHRPHPAHVPLQRRQPPPDRRAWQRRQFRVGVAGGWMRQGRRRSCCFVYWSGQGQPAAKLRG